MKYRILFIIAISLNTIVTAQVEFAPVGARWTSDYHQSVSPFVFPQYWVPKFLDCTGIDTIQGYVCKKLEGDLACAFVDTPIYIRQDGGKVYFYNNQTEDFHLLYDFDAVVGDTWTISGVPYFSNNFYDELEVTVAAVEEIIIGGNILKKMSLDFFIPISPNYQPEWSDIIIEKIGNLDQLFPRHGLCDAPYRGLRCYQDSLLQCVVSDTTITLCIDSSFAEPNCLCYDTLLIEQTIGIPEVQSLQIRLYPVPFSNELRILLTASFASKSCIIHICDTAGRVLTTQDTKGNEEIIIYTESLPAGMYLLTLEAEGYWGIEKVVKINDD